MNLLIVEKEKKEIKKLMRILRLIDPSIKIMQVVDDVHSVLTWIQSNPSPDLVLIEHSQLAILGIHQHHIQAKLVLHTKQYNFTYLAFRTHTLHQLPLSDKERNEDINQIPALNGSLFPGPAPSYQGIPTLFKNRFFVGHGQRFVSVPVEEIAYFFPDGRFVYFTTFEKNKYLIQYRIEELQQLLNPEQFYRINRSYITSVKSIEQINPYFGGRFKLKLVPPVTEDVLVSKKRAAGFKIWLGE